MQESVTTGCKGETHPYDDGRGDYTDPDHRDQVPDIVLSSESVLKDAIAETSYQANLFEDARQRS